MNEINDGKQASLYRQFNLGNSYELMSGVFILPVAESPQNNITWKPVVEVQAFANYRIRHVHYKGNKELTPSLMPAPISTGTFTFLGGNVSIPFPNVNTAGRFTWDVTSDYVFVENCYTDINAGYILGDSPFVYDAQVESTNIFPTFVSGSAPYSVQSAGVGPKVGYNMAQAVDFNDPFYFYEEPSYYPGIFQSTTFLTGAPITLYPPPLPPLPDDYYIEGA